MPIKSIASLEIAYRIHNPNMTAVEAFQEAVGMWKIFGLDNAKVLRRLVERYPEHYATIYEEQFRQHDLFMSDIEWTSLQEFMDSVYPSPRPRDA